MIVATHDLRMTEFATRVLRIEDGRVVAETRGSPVRGSGRQDARRPTGSVKPPEATTTALFELIDGNPVVTDFAYVTDRRPDFFGLHRLFPDSRVVVGEDTGSGRREPAASPRLESCCGPHGVRGPPRRSHRAIRPLHRSLPPAHGESARPPARGAQYERPVVGGRRSAGHHRPGEQGEPSVAGHPPEPRHPAAGPPRSDVRPDRGGAPWPVLPGEPATVPARSGTTTSSAPPST